MQKLISIQTKVKYTPLVHNIKIQEKKIHIQNLKIENLINCT